jgi:hypothetical protein
VGKIVARVIEALRKRVLKLLRVVEGAPSAFEMGL